MENTKKSENPNVNQNVNQNVNPNVNPNEKDRNAKDVSATVERVCSPTTEVPIIRFANIFEQMLENLKSVYPETFTVLYEKFRLYRSINISLVVNTIVEIISPFHKEIYEKNIEAINTVDLSAIKTTRIKITEKDLRESAVMIEKIKEIWKLSDTESKDALFEYLKVFIKLGKKIKNGN